jgi:osmoprotectant transport system ATP-binding protein
MGVIAFDSVSHAYATETSVQHIDLRVNVGETVALIGPSGCGKSTLLKLATGLLEPATGVITVAEVRMQHSTRITIRQRIGYVIQSGGLFPHLSAVENVTLAARHLQRPTQWMKERVAELAELLKLPMELLDRYPRQISGGERQRVSLMRALMLDPQVLLLDEPLGALDPMVRHGLQQDLKRLFAELRKCVLIVTHDMAEAAYFADRLVLMRAGQILQQGTFDDLNSRPAEPFVTEFVRAQRGLHELFTSERHGAS